jgi:hypothetical protein
MKDYGFDTWDEHGSNLLRAGSVKSGEILFIAPPRFLMQSSKPEKLGDTCVTTIR